MTGHLRLFDPAELPAYDLELAGQFIRRLMGRGKRATAQRIFHEALDVIRKRVPDRDAMEVVCQAVEHVKPTVEVRPKRVGGATYQVPVQVNRTRQQSLAIRRLVNAARHKAGQPVALRLAEEILAASGPYPPAGPPGSCSPAVAPSPGEAPQPKTKCRNVHRL